MSQEVAEATAKCSFWQVGSASGPRGVMKELQFRGMQVFPPTDFYNVKAFLVIQGDRNLRKFKSSTLNYLEIGEMETEHIKQDDKDMGS